MIRLLNFIELWFHEYNSTRRHLIWWYESLPWFYDSATRIIKTLNLSPSHKKFRFEHILEITYIIYDWVKCFPNFTLPARFNL